jgi:CHAT domain-containing protein
MALILDISQRQEKLLASLYTPGATVQSQEAVETEWETLIQVSQHIVDLIERNCLLRDLSTGSLSELKKNGQILFDYIIPPKIKPQLKAAGIVDLTFLIDEKLVFIPWELLFDGQEFLCLRFNTGRCVRTSQHVEKSNRPLMRDPLQMLIIADPQGNLPAARREAVLIREKLAGSREIVITTKTKNVYGHYVQKNIREYDLLHYAGHSDFDIQNPQNSGWRMCDGKLTCQDFLKLGASTPLPQLIFMNACQSI